VQAHALNGGLIKRQLGRNCMPHTCCDLDVESKWFYKVFLFILIICKKNNNSKLDFFFLNIFFHYFPKNTVQNKFLQFFIIFINKSSSHKSTLQHRTKNSSHNNYGEKFSHENCCKQNKNQQTRHKTERRSQAAATLNFAIKTAFKLCKKNYFSERFNEF
jgi:hypothetical protein